MPELYSHLNTALTTAAGAPQVIYVSGSPVQIYPTLQPFIAANFPRGPISLRNLTFTDISEIIALANKTSILDFKLSEIEKIHSFYPNKKFVAIGDSTQFDPETYAEM